MKKYCLYSLLLLMSALFTWVSCSDNDDESNSSVSLTKTSLAFVSAGGAQSFQITASDNWTVSLPSDAWYSLSAVSGSSGTSMVTVSVSSICFTKRSDTLSFVSGNASAQLIVSQEATTDLVYTVSTPNSLLSSVLSTGGTLTFTINSTAPVVSVSNDNQWISFDKQSLGFGNSDLTVTVAANTGEKRTGYFYLKAEGAADLRFVIVQNPANFFVSYNTDPIAADKTGMTSTALQLSEQMVLGWNLGNTLEATWGSFTAPTQTLIQNVRAAGFNTIRIPCAWYYNSNQSTAKIHDTWFATVKQVVQWAIDENMYVMLNIHWDKGWLEDNIDDNVKIEEVVARQKAMWEQIATAFRDYDEHLLFASCNEPGQNNGMGTDGIANLKKCHQACLDAVRSTGGKNTYRTIIIQGPVTNIAQTVAANQSFFPTDIEENGVTRLMVEDHFYDPYKFTIMSADASWGKRWLYWGDNLSSVDTDRNSTYSVTNIRSSMKSLYDTYVSKGIPVVIGEFSPSYYSEAPSFCPGYDKDLHKASVAQYLKQCVETMKDFGIIPVYWDNSGLNSGNSGLFNRNTGELDPDRKVFVDSLIHPVLL